MSLNHVNLILPSFLSNGILNIEIKNDFIRQFWGWHQNGWANKMWPLATSGAIIAGARVGGSGLVLPWLHYIHYTPISETIRKIGPQKLCHMYVFLPKIENCFHFLQNEIFILCNHNSSKIWTILSYVLLSDTQYNITVINNIDNWIAPKMLFIFRNMHFKIQQHP